MSKRFIVYDRQLRPLFDLDGRITEATRYERINGEHKLDVKTTQPLEEGLRILTQDGTLKWREWVVDEPQEHKQDYDIVEGSYGCTWSVQYDLSMVSGGELWPGTYSPITAGAALAMVLAVQKRWEVGHVTVTGTAGTSLFDGSVWDYLGKLQEVWGGEFEPRIEVDSNGVTHRYVDWLAHVGSEDATRRFDYGEDCTGIDRKPPVGPMCCRIVPRGGHDATDEDGISYSERVGVEEEPYSSGDGWVHDAGSIWIRDPDAEQLFRTPNPDGTWHYPEMVVTYDTDDPEELVWLASADIHKYTRPSPTYEADVLQFAAAGMDAHGVQLGDVVHIVDRKFGDAPLRIEARIVEMTVNELDESDVQLVIGEATQGIESAFKSMRSAIDAAEERSRRIEGGGTIVYLQHMLDEINAEINGTGGYSYFVPGEGIITYDKRVADPLVGIEADYVTQMKGGSLRFAKTKNADFSGINDWNWTNVITSDGYMGLAATIGAITAGYIGDASAGSYWDLDNGILYISAGKTLADAISDAEKVATNYLSFNTSTGLDIGYDGTSAKTRINASGMEVFDGNGVSALYAGLSGSNSIVRVGRQSGSGNVVMSSEGYVDIRNASTVMAHFGYGEGTNSSGGTSTAPYYDIGTRKSGSTVGNYSVAESVNTTASGYASHAEGSQTTASGHDSHAEGYKATASGKYSHAEGRETAASGDYSHAEGYKATASGKYSHAEGGETAASGDYSHAEGYKTTASGNDSHAEGSQTTASGSSSHAEGYRTTASGMNSHTSGRETSAYGIDQFVCGRWNSPSYEYLFIVGCGSNDSDKRNAFSVSDVGARFFNSSNPGTVYVNGSSVHSSDKRLKNHVAYLEDDAANFIRALKPVRYKWKSGGGEHYGFYAQDVQAADPHDTETVIEDEYSESLGYARLTLDYNALIAPLVAYTQQLEQRVNEQDKTIEAMETRLAVLEARTR